MNKVKLLWLLISILLLANLLLCKALYEQKKRQHEGPRKLIIEKLKFDNVQIAQYDTLIQAHRKAINEKQEQIMQLKNKLYAQLKRESNGQILLSQADSILNALNVKQIEIERVHYTHFKDIKQLCRTEQLPYFEKLTAEIAELFAPGPKLSKQP